MNTEEQALELAELCGEANGYTKAVREIEAKLAPVKAKIDEIRTSIQAQEMEAKRVAEIEAEVRAEAAGCSTGKCE